jgi:hypothetical protein
MSNLTKSERPKFEELLGMGGGCGSHGPLCPALGNLPVRRDQASRGRESPSGPNVESEDVTLSLYPVAPATRVMDITWAGALST